MSGSIRCSDHHLRRTASLRLLRVLGGLRRLLLGGGHRFLLFLLRLEILEHRPEVAQLKLRDLDTVLLLCCACIESIQLNT